MPDTKRKPGRPSLYSDDLAREICRRMANGEALTTICKDPHMPHRSTVMSWVWDEDKQAFADMYARARQQQAEVWADEVVALTEEAVNSDTAQAVRVKVDARKWYTSKILPKFADKQVVSGQIEHSHEHTHTHEVKHDLEQLPKEERRQLGDVLRRIREGAAN